MKRNLLGNTPSPRNSGFTLLELLVSLALLSLIATYLFTSLSFGRRAWEVAGSLSEPAAVQAARDFIRNRLARARPILTTIGNTQRSVVHFEGKRDTVRFAALARGQTEISGVYDILLSTVSDMRGGRSLAVASSIYGNPTNANGRARGSGRPRVLLENIVRTEFSYFGSVREGKRAEWHPTWTEPNRLPTHISIKVVFAEQDKRRWPELSVRLRLSQDH